jgi:succinoglycan biosynthesis protein ExoA
VNSLTPIRHNAGEICADTIPFVSIVVPALNEAGHIRACLASLVGQWPDGAWEILVMDGGSVDATPAIVAAFARDHDAVSLHANPKRNQAAAMNLAARLASPRCRVLLRADAHALYPPDFVRRCVEAMRDNDATSVVVPMHTLARPGRAVQHAIAAAQSSRLGNGGAAHRFAPRSAFVAHGHHAAFDRSFFEALGGYDERFTHNEDAELDVRAAAAGGRIWMCADAPVTYFPRESLGGLARQYFRHGAGRARTLRKHRQWPRPRQMFPLAALAGCLGAFGLAPFDPPLAAAGLLYPLACLAWGAVGAIARRDPRLLVAGPALVTMHLAWATGFLAGVARR